MLLTKTKVSDTTTLDNVDNCLVANEAHFNYENRRLRDQLEFAIFRNLDIGSVSINVKPLDMLRI